VPAVSTKLQCLCFAAASPQSGVGVPSVGMSHLYWHSSMTMALARVRQLAVTPRPSGLAMAKVACEVSSRTSLEVGFGRPYSNYYKFKASISQAEMHV